jgi:hypothetical protein
MPERRYILDCFVAELGIGRIGSVAFVVPSDVWWRLPLYDVAITTARRGWRLGSATKRHRAPAEPPGRLTGR